MTADRDIRFSPSEIHYTTQAVKARMRKLRRSIAAAEASLAAGATIQRGTHERNLEELAALTLVSENLEVARKQIAHKIRESLGMEASVR